MRLLELFKGTGSIGKVAKRKGWDVVSVDINEKAEPSICVDIMEWDYSSYEGTFDYVWASPPCETFSVLQYPRKIRNSKTAEPLCEKALHGTRILHRTLDIIRHFSEKNPKMKWCMENPRGMMRQDARVRPLHRETTTYASYGDFKYKPTDFWSNYDLGLNPVRGIKNYPHITARVANMSRMNDKYSIPPKLIEAIFSYLNRKKILYPMT